MNKLAKLLFIASCVTVNSETYAQGIFADNTAQYAGEGRWDWMIFIKADQEVLSNISCVTYTLDPTFTRQSIDVCNSADPLHPFSYKTNGWGAFIVPIKIQFNDGTTENISYQLKLGRVIADDSSAITADNEYRQIGTGWWEWTVFLKASEDVLDNVKCVKYFLDESFPNPIQEKCEIADNQKPFKLTQKGWGRFTMKIKVFFKDGGIKTFDYLLNLPTNAG